MAEWGERYREDVIRNNNQGVCVCVCVCICMYVYMYMYIFKMFVDLERNGGKGETSIGCPDWNLNPQHLVYGMMFQPAGAQGV